MQPQDEQIKEYYKKLQEAVKEERSKRNQVYELAFILCSILMGIISGRKSRSGLYRYMENHYTDLQEITGHQAGGLVSGRQFNRIIGGVDWESYNEVNVLHFGIEIKNIKQGEWIAIDGKELRGSLETKADGKKENRGEAVVNAVRHKDKQVLASSYYRGDKESEKPTVRELLEKTGLKKNLLH